ncbi:cytochrome P450 [Nocardia sp. NPDC052566]|uniref:cytochrome P450 n=1 Tax=Nocardia sp. NPDC052566 TaxID=3364330 RepID=UPI0037C6DA7A
MSIATARRRLPLVGHLVPLLRDPLGLMTSLPAYGDLVRIGIGPVTAVVVCDPQLTQQVLRRDRVFDKGGPIFERGREIVGDGVPTCPYSRHRRLRRLMQPAFSPSRIAGYASVMSERIAEMTESWCDGQVVDVEARLHTLTSTVAAATLFAQTVPDRTRDRMLREIDIVSDGLMRRTLMPAPLRRLPILGNRAYWRATTGLRAGITEVIAARRAESVDHGDLLSALVTARDTEGNGLSDTEIRDQIVSMFLGGTHTTAATLAWALYLLDRHPGIAGRLHTELDTVLAGRPARYDDLPRLPLTGRIITETLRLWPPIWFLTRTVTEDTELGGHALAKGTTVVYSPYLLHHRADRYPDPERFDPDRWDRASASPPPAALPFGDGARKCIGDSFAVTEATLALATLCARWRLCGMAGQHTGPALPSMTLQPKRLRMRVSARAVPGPVGPGAPDPRL